MEIDPQRPTDVSPTAVDAAPSDPSKPDAPPPKPAGRSPLTLALFAAVAGTIVLAAWMTRSTDTAAAAADAAPSAPSPLAHAASAAPPAAERPVAPKNESQSRWTASRPPQYARYGRDVILFELAADQEIPVWHKRVRPQLAVRCFDRSAEIYVMTYSAASFEGSTNQHTVQVGFDGAAPVEQKWDHSVDHEALFAPESGTFLDRLASAREMSFRFTPFNAAAVDVHFRVDGFAAHLSKAARTCGKKR